MNTARVSKDLSQLLEISHDLNSTLDLNSLIRCVTEKAAQLLRAERASFGLVEDGAVVIRDSFVAGRWEEVERRYPEGLGGVGWVLKHKRPYLSNDAPHDQQLQQERVAQLGAKRLAIVPILGREGAVIGALTVFNKLNDAPFTEADVKILTALANQAAVALENARLFQKVQASERSLRLFRNLLDQSHDAVFLIDAKTGLLVEANQTACESLGYSRDELLRMGVRDIEGELPEVTWDDHMARLRCSGTLRAEDCHRRKDGQSFPVEVSLRLVRQDSAEYVVAIAHDITERKQWEKEQKILYQLAHDLARSLDTHAIADHLFTWARNLLGIDYGFLMLANAEGIEFRGVAAYGIDAEAFRQERIEVGKELTPAVIAFQKKQLIVTTDLARDLLVSERLRAKYYFVKSVWGVPLVSGERAVGIFFVGYATRREATPEELRFLQLLGDEVAPAIERARLTEALRESEGHYRSLFESAPIGLFRTTPAGQILDVNPASVQMFGYSDRDSLLAVNVTNLYVNPEARKQLQASLEREGAVRDFEVQGQRRDGTIIWVRLNMRAVRDSKGRVLYEGSIKDISAKKELEQQRTEFLAMLTHDIKNPLAVISGYTEILLEEVGKHDTAEEEGILQRLRSNVLTIHSLIANYLDPSKEGY